jgi:ketopantoate reductase
VGGIFAARLARTCEVAVLDTWADHVQAIAARGLHVTVRAALGNGGRAEERIEARPTEIDTLTGALVAEADRAGISVPVLQTVYRLVKAAETAAVARRAAAEVHR